MKALNFSFKDALLMALYKYYKLKSPIASFMKFGKIHENLLSRKNGMNHENLRPRKFGAIRYIPIIITGHPQLNYMHTQYIS